MTEQATENPDDITVASPETVRKVAAEISGQVLPALDWERIESERIAAIEELREYQRQQRLERDANEQALRLAEAQRIAQQARKAQLAEARESARATSDRLAREAAERRSSEMAASLRRADQFRNALVAENKTAQFWRDYEQTWGEIGPAMTGYKPPPPEPTIVVVERNNEGSRNIWDIDFNPELLKRPGW